MKNYIDLNVSPDDAQSLMGKIIFAVHGANSRNNNPAKNLKISFPDWSEPVIDERGKKISGISSGSCIRIFADDAALNDFMNSRIPSRMLCSGALSTLGAKAVPELAASTQYVRFIRDRSRERATDGEALRRENRRVKRAEQRAKSGKSEIEYKRSEKIEVRSSVKFELPSLKGDCKFPFYISMINVGEVSSILVPGSSTYGLSNDESVATPVF